jgi:hypothetical protein
MSVMRVGRRDEETGRRSSVRWLTLAVLVAVQLTVTGLLDLLQGDVALGVLEVFWGSAYLLFLCWYRLSARPQT